MGGYLARQAMQQVEKKNSSSNIYKNKDRIHPWAPPPGLLEAIGYGHSHSKF